MYGKLVNGTLQMAPGSIVIGTMRYINPLPEHYAQAGYKPVTFSEIPEGHEVTGETYTETADGITVTYTTQAVTTLDKRVGTLETDLADTQEVVDYLLFSGNN